MNSELQNILDRVTAEKRLRVWSVILTFFGDAVLPRGKKVSAQTVSQLLQCLGIEDGAVRTAFSRLANDGWVIRSRSGRSSFYELAEKGLKPFTEATTRIYAIPHAEAKPTTDWISATCAAGDKAKLKAICEEFRGLMVDGNLVIFNQPSDALRQKLQHMKCLITKGSEAYIPDWIRQNEELSTLASEFQTFQETFKSLPSDLPPLEAMAARCLLIHEWRRLVLKLPDIPADFLPENWPAQQCGQLVAAKYKALIVSSENWMDEKAEATEAWQKPDISFQNRFDMLQK